MNKNSLYIVVIKYSSLVCIGYEIYTKISLPEHPLIPDGSCNIMLSVLHCLLLL